MKKSFIGRKEGLMKKARELSVLCGVQVGLVIFGPDKTTPRIWPENRDSLRALIQRYFNKDRNFKTTQLGKENVKTRSVADEIDGLSTEKLSDLLLSLDGKLQIVNSRIDMIQKQTNNNVVGSDSYGSQFSDNNGYGSQFGSQFSDNNGYGSQFGSQVSDNNGYGSQLCQFSDDNGYGSQFSDNKGYGSQFSDNNGGSMSDGFLPPEFFQYNYGSQQEDVKGFDFGC